MKFILGAIVVVFTFWGVGSFRSQRLDIMAKVNGQKILVEDYQKAYNNTVERLRRRYGGSLPESILKQMNLKQGILDQLIDSTLIEQEAGKMGVRVTDKEIQQIILGVSAFRQDGAFSDRLYKMALRNAGLKPVDFEQDVRKNMYLRKVRSLVTAGIFVPDSEAAAHYRYNNAEINVEFVKIDASECIPSVNATDSKVKGWFESHREEFETDPQISLKYILFDRKAIEKDVNATDMEIREYYQEHPGEFHIPESRRASHILLRLPPDANATQVQEAKKKAEELEKQIKAGKSFEALAKKYSEDTGSAAKGGDLGFFQREKMIKPFADKAFSMKEGQVSKPVRTKFGFHIIKLVKIKPAGDKSLKEVRPLIAKKIKDKKTEKIIWEKANRAYDQIIEMGSLEAYADSANKTIEQTGFFSRKQPAPVVGVNPKILGAVFSLGKGELSSLLDVPQGVLIGELADKKAPYIPAFEEIRNRATATYATDRSLELCKVKADKILKEAEKKGFAAAAGSYKLKIEETGLFKRTDRTGGGNLPQPVVKEALSLYKAKPLPDKVSSYGRSFYIIHLKDIKETADMKAFKAKKAGIKKAVRQWKVRAVFTDWLKHQRDKAEIEIVRKP